MEGRWPNQIRGHAGVLEARAQGHRKICVSSPTGTGKGQMISDLIEADLAQSKKIILYTNRKILIEQLSKTLAASGIRHGIRAADYEPDLGAPVQISSVQTETSRVVNRGTWELHNADSIVIDEAHLNANDAVLELQRRHLEKPGSTWTGYTATPIDLAHMYDFLVEAGTKKEGRECGSLVYARHIGIDEPDMRNYRQNVKTGEYTEGDVTKAIMTKNVFGRVYEHWNQRNPDRKPTILFGPGVDESLWFAKQFREKGVRSAHVDGEKCWLDGEEYPTTREVREQILDGVRSGEITVLCNRFVLREGVNLPNLEYLIFATVVGSLQGYLQMTGRILRSSPSTGKKNAVILDHGGHYWRHGSVNVDREWNLGYTDRMMQAERIANILDPDKPDKEPIRCPKCSAIRGGGTTCPECGYKATRQSRMVVQQDGRLVEHTGDIFTPREVRYEDDTVKKWKSIYWACRKSGKTFTQALGWFEKQYGYRPPMDIPLMPLRAIDTYKLIADVPMAALVRDARPSSEEYSGSLFQ